MLARLRAAGLAVPALLTLAGLVVLLSLGTWQMSRKAWKDAWQARIEARARAAPVGVDAVMGLYTGSFAEGLRETVEYVRASVRGRFLHDREQHLYAPHPKLGSGVHVLTPFEVTGGAGQGGVVLLVNRGYVPDAFRAPEKRSAGQIGGETTVTGLVRLPAIKEPFTPDNEPARRFWYWRDIDGILAAALPDDRRRRLPFMLDAELEPKPPGGWPQGGATIVKLPNRHLEYALTWYGLAATLAGVFLIYARGRLQAPARR
jgi:surfeit locus 1 family protein